MKLEEQLCQKHDYSVISECFTNKVHAVTVLTIWSENSILLKSGVNKLIDLI